MDKIERTTSTMAPDAAEEKPAPSGSGGVDTDAFSVGVHVQQLYFSQ
jgi:hypothetical protein